MNLDIVEFIETKKTGRAHRPGTLIEFINSVVAGEIPDYQVTAWLMAVCFTGLKPRETTELTLAMAGSGKVYEWDDDGPPVVDKHSTGGVGDTVTLVLAPLVAAMGMRMGKHSGRGLGHTGGTIDKLESIPGFSTSLSEKEFRRIVNRVGCAVAGQDESMTPADGILYSLRDVTATVNEESLIASSIMSKKLAGGASNILLDVKVGSGAFMKDLESANSLAKLMAKIGRNAGVNVKTMLSSMESPLGCAVGNALEVREAIHVLANEVPETDPLRIISIEMAARLGVMCGLGKIQNTRSRARLLLNNGAALDRFSEMVKLQGGDPNVTKDPESVLPSARKVLKVSSSGDGYLASCDALAIGELVRDLGGGRKNKGDKIDQAVGVILLKRPGDKVSKGEPLCEIHTNRRIPDNQARDTASKAFRIKTGQPEIAKLILN